MKKLGIWALALFLLASHVFVRASLHADEGSSWKAITAKTGDCRISFPSVPKLIQQSLKVSEQGHKLSYDVYLAPLTEQSLCLLLVATYPFPLKGGHELAGIEGLLNGILGQNPDNKLLFANVIDHSGHKAVDFMVQSSTSYFRGQALMVGNKLYLLAIEGKAGALDEKSFNKFAGSFALTK